MFKSAVNVFKTVSQESDEQVRILKKNVPGKKGVGVEVIVGGWGLQDFHIVTGLIIRNFERNPEKCHGANSSPLRGINSKALAKRRRKLTQVSNLPPFASPFGHDLR